MQCLLYEEIEVFSEWPECSLVNCKGGKEKNGHFLHVLCAQMSIKDWDYYTCLTGEGTCSERWANLTKTV